MIAQSFWNVSLDLYYGMDEFSFLLLFILFILLMNSFANSANAL